MGCTRYVLQPECTACSSSGAEFGCMQPRLESTMLLLGPKLQLYRPGASPYTSRCVEQQGQLQGRLLLVRMLVG